MLNHILWFNSTLRLKFRYKLPGAIQFIARWGELIALGKTSEGEPHRRGTMRD